MRTIPFLILLLAFSVNACGQKSTTSKEEKKDTMGEFEIKKSDAEWKAQLTDDQYQILRLKGTEKPFSGKYYYENDEGIYCCAACNNPLFKFVSVLLSALAMVRAP